MGDYDYHGFLGFWERGNWSVRNCLKNKYIWLIVFYGFWIGGDGFFFPNEIFYLQQYLSKYRFSIKKKSFFLKVGQNFWRLIKDLEKRIVVATKLFSALLFHLRSIGSQVGIVFTLVSFTLICERSLFLLSAENDFFYSICLRLW